jgi:type VI secretion system protein VasG
MIDVDLKQLVRLLDATCLRAVNDAIGQAVRANHYEVLPEHLLVALMEAPKSDVATILAGTGVDLVRWRRTIDAWLAGRRSGNTRGPTFSPALVDWLKDAWLHTSVDRSMGTIRSGVLLVVLHAQRRRLASTELGGLLAELSAEAVREPVDAGVPGSEEYEAAASVRSAAGNEGAPAEAESALSRFAVDYTAQAREGSLDPVFGRDEEIRRMVDILARRRKNNPILVGDPGVGKSAIVEGLALRIAAGDAPPGLENARILGLDLGLLQAGAGVRGELEKRLKAVIEEVKGSAMPIVLFIDEAHTLVGAQGGSDDAANLLKPALARGELRTIAATTWREYKKYFEKDPALARRFELVTVDEPSPERALIMLRGLAARYSDVHGVHVQDAAVRAAVELSHRYLSGRQLPDKAVGLLDTCAARVKVARSGVPARLEGLRRSAETLDREADANRRDVTSRIPGVVDRTAELMSKAAALRVDAAALHARWEQEQAAVQEVIELRRRLIVDGDKAAEAQLDDALARLGVIQVDEPLVHSDVGPEVVAEVVSAWTGIPVGRMLKDQAGAALSFEQEMERRVKGQTHALEMIGERIRQAKAGLNDPNQPLAVFLLVGPSGVGKTETALGLADLMYGGERSVITVNMSEFQEQHSMSRLIGSPPGYVGHGEGGMLTEAVRQRPYSVVLLDECEKAHLGVMKLFYQVFDKGSLADGESREVDFRNTILLMTSNLATADIMRHTDQGVTDPEALAHLIRPVLSKHFEPALLGRMTVVPYFPLSNPILREIAELKLRKIAQRVLGSQRATLSWSDEVPAAIAERCVEVETGARNVDHILRHSLLPALARAVLGTVGDDIPTGFHVSLGASGQFEVTTVGDAA